MFSLNSNFTKKWTVTALFLIATNGGLIGANLVKAQDLFAGSGDLGQSEPTEQPPDEILLPSSGGLMPAQNIAVDSVAATAASGTCCVSGNLPLGSDDSSSSGACYCDTAVSGLNDSARYLYRYFVTLGATYSLNPWATVTVHNMSTSPQSSGVFEARWKIFADEQPGTRPLYLCNAHPNTVTAHVMASLDPQCEGQDFRGLAGWITTAPADGLVTLSRCATPGGEDHIVSQESNCEGLINEGILGYASAGDM